MSTGVINSPIPLKDQVGFFLPEDGGTYVVDSIVKGKGMTSFYQRNYGIDQYIELPAGKRKANFITFLAEQFQLQGVTPGSCEKMESHGGFKNGNGSISTCPIGHYSTFCPQGNLVKCHQHVINPSSDAEVLDSNLNLMEIQMQKLAKQVLRGIPAHLTLGGTYSLDSAGNVTAGGEILEKPANVKNGDWESFKRELTVNCDGWLKGVTEFCNIFEDYKDDLKKCKSAAERVVLYDEIFAKLLCCAEDSSELSEALDGNLESETGEQLMPYIRISRAMYKDLNIITRNNSAKQENGCNSVCNAFNYETVQDGDYMRKVVYWNNYMLVVDEGLCMWDNMIGGTTYAAFFTVAKNIQITAGWEYLDDDIIPIDYLNGMNAGNYNRPVLAVQKKSQSINCKEWEAKMTMLIGSGVCSSKLIAGDYCVIK